MFTPLGEMFQWFHCCIWNRGVFQKPPKNRWNRPFEQWSKPWLAGLWGWNPIPSDFSGVFYKPGKIQDPGTWTHQDLTWNVRNIVAIAHLTKCCLGMMSTSYSSVYLHITSLIQVLNFVHLDFLLLGTGVKLLYKPYSHSPDAPFRVWMIYLYIYIH